MPVDFVNSVKKKLNKVPYAAEYLAIKDACLHALKDGNYEYKNYPELSYRAWIVSEQVNQEKAEVKGKKSSKAAFLRWFAPLIQALRDVRSVSSTTVITGVSPLSPFSPFAP